ncbi:hypothetical protein GCM10012285_27780 [Streptomyces kronopolitis]|uniref:Uncharacterized protein n=1 Tax=Streptomyces kronopolitis TaxID=1612435 RepID=A0ABQ2JCJ4_9ACTN|nr:hypothetical protein GCM10012285_27780 [Streptomyces kronopolitis]
MHISGPMTDLPDIHFPSFDKAEHCSKKPNATCGTQPTTFDQDQTRDRADCMRVDISELPDGEDAVYVLAGWGSSRGTRQHEIARQLGLQILRADGLVVEN